MKKVLVILFIGLFFVSFASALQARMGNSRMILRLDKGETVEKYIQVFNANNETINIEMTASGDLADYVDIKDNNFTLLPGEDKKAYFDVTAGKEGTTETKIYVKFSPVGGGNGVGLASTVIVISGDASITYDNKDNNVDTKDTNSSIFSKLGLSGNSSISDNSLNIGATIKKIPAGVLILVAILVLLVLLLVLLVVIKKKAIKPEKRLKKKSG